MVRLAMATGRGLSPMTLTAEESTFQDACCFDLPKTCLFGFPWHGSSYHSIFEPYFFGTLNFSAMFFLEHSSFTSINPCFHHVTRFSPSPRLSAWNGRSQQVWMPPAPCPSCTVWRNSLSWASPLWGNSKQNGWLRWSMSYVICVMMCHVCNIYIYYIYIIIIYNYIYYIIIYNNIYIHIIIYIHVYMDWDVS